MSEREDTSEQRKPASGAANRHDDVPSGYEPTPLPSLARLSYYPWLVVGTTCIGAFIGQLDASIVQLALPALEREFDARLSVVSWVAIAYPMQHFDRDVFTYQPSGENAYGRSAVRFAVTADRKATAMKVECLDINHQGTFSRT